MSIAAPWPEAPAYVSTLTDALAAFAARVELVCMEAVGRFGRCTDNAARLRVTHSVAADFRAELEREEGR